ncbi:hypothetical protein BDI4_1530013 [Burkholderia diffusa]|nr:hypothetical protein BDI4_1530013 [Burkholderia diffusa]
MLGLVLFLKAAARCVYTARHVCMSNGTTVLWRGFLAELSGIVIFRPVLRNKSEGLPVSDYRNRARKIYCLR